MKEFKGTKGPWVWEHNSASTDEVYCIEIKDINSPFSIASLQSYEGVVEISRESTIKNANLIAAAPELLEVLQLARHVIVTMLPEKSASRKHVVRMSDLVIAKALGENK